jgi:2-iminobutanoate/2-iminopropanoate deaminase
MSAKISFNSTGVKRGNIAIPQAAIAGGLIYVSGMAGVDPQSGKILTDSYEEQAYQAFKNIKTVLEEAGSSLDKIVKTTIFMVAGMDTSFAIINKVYTEFFPENPPARSAPQVMPFPGGILISVECIAVV